MLLRHFPSRFCRPAVALSYEPWGSRSLITCCLPSAAVCPALPARLLRAARRPPIHPRSIKQQAQTGAGSASITADMMPWSSVILETTGPEHAFSANSLLDLWAKGPGITRVAFYLEDTHGLKYSK